MEDLLVYLFRSAVVLTALFVPFLLLLRNEKNILLNRSLLIGTMLVSLSLPLMNISLPQSWLDFSFFPAEDTNTQTAGSVIVGQLSASEAVVVPEENWLADHWMNLLTAFWVIGIVWYLIKQIESLLFIHRITHSEEVVSQTLDGGQILYLVPGSMPSFSWMNIIVMSVEDYSQNGDTILLHEQAHIHSHHSLDKLLLMLCQALQWWNPFVWLLGDALGQTHEYEADQTVINSGINATQYQLLLISKAAGPAGLALVNGFKHNKLKSRIIMMNKSNQSRFAWARYSVLVPMLFVAFLVSAQTKPAPSESKQATVELTPSKANVEETKPDDAVFTVCENQPEFPGGEKGLMEYLQKNLKYPEQCLKDSIQGRVIVSFIVEKDGSISNVEEVKSSDPRLTEEAKRMVSNMPKWEPGTQRGEKVRVKYVLPVTFKLN